MQTPGALLLKRLIRGVLDRYNFYRVKHHLKTLSDHTAKIAYLFDIKTEYLQQSTNLQLKFIGFDHQCNWEIERLEKLAALGESSKGIDETQLEDVAGRRNLEFTTARQVLAIHYLLNYCKATQVSNADIARFIVFLTGKNYKNVYKRVCNPLDSRNKELNEDLRFIRAFFEKLKMPEIVKMINNEIESDLL